MKLVQEFFEKTTISPLLVFIDNSKAEDFDNAVPAQQIHEVILIADKRLWYEDLYLREGHVIKNTGLFMSAWFSNTDGTIDYCYQVGRNSSGEYMGTLVKVSHDGVASPTDHLFKQNNQAINDQGELLTAQYLATYKDGKWLVLDEQDRVGILNCESPEILNRAYAVSF